MLPTRAREEEEETLFLSLLLSERAECLNTQLFVNLTLIGAAAACLSVCNEKSYYTTHNNNQNKKRKFSTMDVLVPISMKNAAKCDKQCELQNSANHQIFERKWRRRDTLPACLFQCLRGFTTPHTHLNVIDATRLSSSLSWGGKMAAHTRSLMKDARVDLSVQWRGHTALHVISLGAIPNYPHTRGSADVCAQCVFIAYAVRALLSILHPASETGKITRWT